MASHGQGCVVYGLPAQALVKAAFTMVERRARPDTTPKSTGGKE